MAITVLIADDQAMVRAGFRMILEAQRGIEVMGESPDGEHAVASVRHMHPDVVVMDIRMPGIDGVDATRRILSGDGPHPHVLVVTTFDDDDYLYEALRAGAAGFLLKNAPPEELVEAVRAVAAGEGTLASTVTRRVIREFARRAPVPTPDPEQFADLTARELDVFRLMARGLSNAEIAERLVVSPGTVKTHVGRVLMKLGLRDRIQAVVLGYETGLVTPGDPGPQ